MDDKSGSLSYTVGEDMPGPYKSIIECMKASASTFADEIAVVCAHQSNSLYGIQQQRPGEEYLRWTFREFYSTVEILSGALAAKGISAGTPVFTFLPNGVEFLLVAFASWRLGCSVVPISIRNLANQLEVTHMVKTAFLACGTSNAVVFADSSDTAAKLDEIEDLGNAQRIVTAPDYQRWVAFESLIHESASHEALPDFRLIAEKYRDRAVMFTSGTTSLPKGCQWRHGALAYYCHSRSQLGDRFATKNGDVFMVTVPNNHAMGFALPVIALVMGATIVYPSPYFEPNTFLKVAQAERCTHTIAVPTMVYALVLAKANLQIGLDHLKSVFLGGAAVTPEVLRLCEKELGAQGCEVFYGMTEGVMIYSGRSSIPELTDTNGDVSCGSVPPCSRVKICAPGSHEPLPRGQAGEIHGSGPVVCGAYVSNNNGEFYEEDGVGWCTTGDMGRMDEHGRVFVIGRYKEMIIRGGENISPVAIETVIGKQLPHLRDLMVQIVGAADEIAGEVPVALIAQKASPETIAEIKSTVIAKMGRMYAIDEVIFIGDLGLDDLPRTLAGKIQKTKLKELVQAYYKKSKQQEENTNGFVNSALKDQLTTIWARVIGVPLSEVSLNTSLEDMADSITMMRAKDRLFKRTGVDLTVREMLDAGTLGGLLSILERRILTVANHESVLSKPNDSPPTMDQMVHALDDEDIFNATKNIITTAIAPAGLAWKDVRDVMPALDLEEVGAKRGIFPRLNLNLSLSTRETTVTKLREALMQALANNPLQSSFIVWDAETLGDDIALQITVDQNAEFLGKYIEDRGSLNSVSDLRRLTYEMIQKPAATYPGPLFRAWLFYIEETQSAALIYNAEHTVNDATTSQLFLEDLDLALSGADLRPHVSYKTYCDHFYTMRTSPAARAATKYHVKRLVDLPKHKAHFFPPPEKPMLLEDGKLDGYKHIVPADGINRFMRKYTHLKPSIVLKAATALFLLHTTRHTHAVFIHWDSSRDKFPFTTASSALPAHVKASDVSGQLINPILNLISLNSDETKLAFLGRLQEEQTQQSKYAAAPFKEIMKSMDPETAEMFPHYSTECVYNWLGTNIQGTNAYANFELIEANNRQDMHRFYHGASLIRDGKGGDKLVLQMRGSAFSVAELKVFAGKIGKIAAWLVENLDESIEGFEQCLEEK